jgi:hypothetical protein
MYRFVYGRNLFEIEGEKVRANKWRCTINTGTGPFVLTLFPVDLEPETLQVSLIWPIEDIPRDAVMPRYVGRAW